MKASFVSRLVSCLIRWYNKPSGDITKEFWEKAIQFHATFHGLKITDWQVIFKYFIQKREVAIRMFIYLKPLKIICEEDNS